MKRLEITRSDAIAIIKSLRKENLIKPVEEAKDDRHPSPKFVFKTKKPASLLAGKTLYIKLSSPDSCFKVYVDSFHEDKMPEECDEWRN